MLASIRERIGKMHSICALAVIAAALIAPAAQAAQTGTKLVPPKADYLALGDSLAFGYQEAKFRALLGDPPDPTRVDPAAFNTGYVDDFSAALAPLSPGIDTVNYGCPGETTDSFLGVTPCGYALVFRLHDSYSGSQMGAAQAFLSAHPRETSPVTIDIGANDVLATVSACRTDPAPFPDAPSCVAGRAPATFAHIVQNLGTILTNIDAAAPKTETIVIGVYNPLVIDPVLGGPASDALAAQLNSLMANTAAAHGDFFADPLPVFNPPDNEIATICTLTFVCGPLHDIHATDAGYQALADVVFAASGYSKLGQ
jgi:lysophospholipase L1-like esterase